MTPVLAVAAVAAIGLATRVPQPALPAETVARFSFERQDIPSVAVDGMRSVRQVEPALERYRSWISGVGAAVALTDLDGNGRSDDQCLVDPRTDTVTVSPAAGSGDRYRPFVLDPQPLPFARGRMAPTGCLPGDFDEDGRTDFLTYFWGRTPILFTQRPGTRLDGDAFERRDLVSSPERWYTDTVAFTDVDGDGHGDLVVGNYFPDGARVLDPAADRDPALEMNASMSAARNGGRARVLLWTADGFREAPNPFPHGGTAWTLAIGAHDLDGDLLPELYFANDFGPDWLLLNRSTPGQVRLEPLRGDASFGTPKSKMLGNDSFKGMGVDFADMDGDRDTDIFVSNITSRFGLIESNFAWINDGRGLAGGRAPFSDESERLGLARSGWGWDAKFGDFANTGVPQLVQTTGFLTGKKNLWPQVTELAMANDDLLDDPSAWMNVQPGDDIAGGERVRFFVRTPDGRWANAAKAVGVDGPAVSRGVATADVDGDGRLDFAVANQWAASYLYLNRCRRCGRSLSIRLLRRRSGESGPLVVREAGRVDGLPAVGAAVTLEGHGRFASAEVDTGNGHASVRTPELHFGLGDAAADQTYTITVRWRDLDGEVRRTALDLTAGRWTVLLPEEDDDA